MNHKGIDYLLQTTETPGLWKWQFQIGDTVKTGRTEAKLDLLAIRRVQLLIDRELAEFARTSLMSDRKQQKLRQHLG
jgi:hypothetical protein